MKLRIVGSGAGHARGREAIALVLWTSAVFIGLSLASYGTGTNWVGSVGEAAAGGLVWLVGVVAWVIPIELVLLGIPFVRHRDSLATPARLAGDLLMAVVAAALVQVGWAGQTAFSGHIAGGAVGELFGEVARSLFSTIGSFLVGFACIGLLLISRAAFSFIALVNWVGRLTAKGASGTAHGARSVAEAWKTARELEKEEREKDRIAALPKVNADPDDEAIIASLPEPNADAVETDTTAVEVVEQEKPKRQRKKKEPELEKDLAEVLAEARVEPVVAAKEEEAPKSKVKKAPPKKKEEEGLTIVDTSAALEQEKPVSLPKKEKSQYAFKLPQIEFLEPAGVDSTIQIDREALYKDAELLTKTLADYGVSGKVEEVLPGPTVTT
ncbi:MAG TPA: DNA translocase FtsK 4TM domain-containing protein, partial [Polyangiaceae bacterium]|nr:DNA translocase FtsK 4TM domain-containing protein [Polyangiaceae bacterium]